MVMAATVLVMPCPDLTQIIRTAGDTIGGLIYKNDASIYASLINGEMDFSDYTRSHRGKRVRRHKSNQGQQPESFVYQMHR